MNDINRRNLLRAAAAAGITLPYAHVFCAQASPLHYQLKPIPIGDGAWMLAGVQEAIKFENGGAIANITILDSRDGAIVIDTGPSRRFGEQLAELARSLTGKAIARVYVTHFHPDHAFGNQAFDADVIAAPQGVIDGLKDIGASFSDAMYYIARDWMRGTEVVLPHRAVQSSVEEIGGRRLHLLSLSGHTPSDLAVFDETSGLLIAGDLAFLDRAPTTPHANLDNWYQALQKLEGLSFGKLVPGHGPAEGGKRAITQTREWLTVIQEHIQRSFERGEDILEAAAAPLPPALEKLALARYEFQRSVMHFYPQLEAKRLPSVGKKV